MPGRVVLRDLKGCARFLYFDSLCGRHAHGQAGQGFVDLEVSLLLNADPARIRDGLDERVGDRLAPAVATVDVETWVEEAAVVALAEDPSAPGERSFAGGIEPAVTRIDAAPGAVRERQALAVDSDTFDNGRIRRNGRAIAAKKTRLETRTERSAA